MDGSPALLALGRLAGAAETVNAGVTAALAVSPTSWTANAAPTAATTASDVRETRARRRAGIRTPSTRSNPGLPRQRAKTTFLASLCPEPDVMSDFAPGV